MSGINKHSEALPYKWAIATWLVLAAALWAAIAWTGDVFVDVDLGFIDLDGD